MMRDIKFVGADVIYTYQLGQNCSCWVVSSEENNLSVGDLRVFGNVVMKVKNATYGDYRNSYDWVPLNESLHSQDEFGAWVWKFNNDHIG